jgi:hypothetical protein
LKRLEHCHGKTAETILCVFAISTENLQGATEIKEEQALFVQCLGKESAHVSGWHSELDSTDAGRCKIHGHNTKNADTTLENCVM